MNLANPQWWYALAAYVKDRAESFIGFCLWVANELDDRRSNVSQDQSDPA